MDTKRHEQVRPLTLDRPAPLNPARSIAVAVVVCVALVGAIYYAITVG